jgi:clan AA aspartic protease (TIGR02281 family)
MKRLVKSACLVLAGVVVGWWLRDLAYQKTPFFADEPIASSDVSIAISAPTRQFTTTGTIAINRFTVPESMLSPEAVSFAELLESQEYDLAIGYYETAAQIDERHQALLKPELVEYLRARVQGCAGGVFIDLVELWLEAYYADIEVLLLLADNQRFCGSPEEAARTLQIANAYAVNPGQLESVAAAVARLVVATDKHLTKQQGWIELLGFYELLEAIDLATNTSQLRRASLYERIGEMQYSRELLLELRENDDRMNGEWTAALNLQLANSAQQPFAKDRPQHEIPLTRRGNHYLVAAAINGVSQLALVIDTGASITTLSKESFSQIDNTGVRYLGTQLFNTPNGMTQGEMFRVDSIQLGEIKILDLEIAVLDFEPSDGLDGLLGMNVLRNYRFEIDQDKEILFMSPRL